jgi:hypothetical protein
MPKVTQLEILKISKFLYYVLQFLVKKCHKS